MGDPQDRDRLAGHYEIGRRDGGSSWHLGARRWKDCAECVESVHRLAAGVTLSPTPPDALSMRLDTIRSAVAAMIDPKSESYDRLTRNGAFRDVLDLIDAAKP